MAYSGSRDFTLTRDEIITEAMEKAGVLATGENPTADQTASAKRTLNIMVKGWQTRGINLWTVVWKSMPLSASSHVVDASAQIYECVRNHTSAATDAPVAGVNSTTNWVKREVADTWASGAVYAVGAIVLGTDAQAYKCIVAHTGAAANKPITGGSYATNWAIYATTWVVSTAYTSICNQALPDGTIDIDGMFARINSQDYDIDEITMKEYFGKPSKYTTKQDWPNNYWFHQKLSPEIYLYPFPNSTSTVIHYGQVLYLQDMDSGSDNPDFPVKWYDALVCGLAYKLGFKYQVDQEAMGRLKSEADREFRFASGDDNQGGNLHVKVRKR